MEGGPRISLEQYATSGHLAAQVVYLIHSRFDEICGQSIIDLGCGPGILGLGAALLGAKHVLGVDIYPPALATAVENRKLLGLESVVDFVLADVLTLDQVFHSYHVRKTAARETPLEEATTVRGAADDDGGGGKNSVKERCSETEEEEEPPSEPATVEQQVQVVKQQQQRRAIADVVLLNPPFGTKKGNKGIDMLFLMQAARLAGQSIYSFHKTSTRTHILKVTAGWGLKGEVLAEMVFELPKMYKAHRKESVDIQVDLWRFVVPSV